ncbi:MAG: Na/Pi cotransporter family protein [Chloroflexota bacterium]|nr:MAG: Na/Pi cotransporter family protein [Chloroflexota bacterium]
MLGLLQIMGGLALFLIGIRMLSAGMEKLAGEQIQKWMDRVTSGRLKSAAFGAVATALIQSSGLLMVTMIGLINANLMSVEQAIGVMLGQEIGTTLTAQIVAFDIGNSRLILLVLGYIFLEFFPKRDWKKYGEILLGLGIIFVGMGFMSQALNELVKIHWVSTTLVAMGQHPWIGVLAGIIITSITQSSTAVTSMVVAMGISQVITIQGAVGIILGANIGSCITGLIASLRLSSTTARQASLAQILINVFGVLLFLPFISQYANVIQLTSTDLPRQIANAHTIFNVTVSALLFPFVKPVARIVERIVPVNTKEKTQKLTAYIDEMQYGVPAVALNEAARELTRIGEVTAEMVELSCRALIEKEIGLAEEVLTKEDSLVDPVCKELGNFVNVLMREDLSQAQQKRCFQLRNLMTDVERVGDLAEDIAQYAIERMENNVPFTHQAIHELERASQCANDNYRLALRAFQESSHELGQQVCRQESEFDHLYWHTRQMHIERLEAGLCHPEADVIFTETLRSLERISDHADNLGVSVSRS